jgi:hypothetical protein
MISDCEGCEYAIMQKERDEEVEEFFAHVHQLNIEFHVERSFLSSEAKAQNLAYLLHMLKRAGLRLVKYDASGCGRDRPGVRSCIPEVIEAGFQCENADCSSYLFAKV